MRNGITNTPQEADRSTLRGCTGLALRGYAPLVVLALSIALLLAAVPAKERAVNASGPDAGSSSKSIKNVGAAPPGASLGTTCEGGAKQTKEPYSPPCILFKGDNGGATSNGVTKDTIIVTARTGNIPSLFATVGSIVKNAGIKDGPEDIRRTTQAFFDYFNKKFQLYGRKVKYTEFKGVGDQLAEFLGANPEGAQADALTAAHEVHSFADITALTTPYAESLARQKVLALPPVHMSARWHREHAPYAWGALADCTLLVDTLVDWMDKRVFGHPARYAGDPAFRTRERSIGLLVPEQPWYQECAKEGVQKLDAAGFKFAHQINYPLDLNRISTDAVSMAAQLKARSITTVACVCDPILPLFLTGQAAQQGYFPEWIVAGTALTDVDILGQIYDKEQWKHAFGLSFLSDVYRGMKAESYRAYKTIRNDEPAFVADVLYYPILMLFIGIHMAGPNLTPESFEQGMFNYPPTVGETGKWSFGPNDYTATDDAREIYFDPVQISPFDNVAGRYMQVLQGRYAGATWPQGEATFPIKP